MRPQRPTRPTRQLPLLLLALSLLPAACAPGRMPPGVSTDHAYAFHVPLHSTFDMTLGRPLEPGEAAPRLRGVRLLFLGEHHADTRSHAFQLEVLEALVADGRQVAVALEMFPPSADPVLDQWRRGRLDETAFVEASGWYKHWGFPWAFYRDIFLAIRRHGLPVRGVNASKDTRRKARQGKLEELPEAVRGELEGLNAPLEPQEQYLMDALRHGGHTNGLTLDAPRFRAYSRVQRTWERLMGQRAARWAESRPPGAITVVLIGAGHLAHGLGANLRAARVSTVRQLSVWEAIVSPRALEPDGRYRVPIGVAQWVRVYPRSEDEKGYPSLTGLKLEQDKPEGKEQSSAEAPGGSPGLLVNHARSYLNPGIKVFKKGDRILTLNGSPVTTPTALRMAFERLPFGTPARFSVLRDGRKTTVELTPEPLRGF